MKPKKQKTGSVKIDPLVYVQVADYCKSKGTLVSFFITEAAKEKLEKEKQLVNT